MIKIEVANAESQTDNGLEDITNSTLLLVARSMADRLRERTKGIACKKHPRHVHSITIRPLPNTLKLEHSEFCCHDFETEISRIVKI